MLASSLPPRKLSVYLWLLLVSGAITTTQAQTHVYVTNSCDNTIGVIDTETNTVVANVPVAPGAVDLAVTPDGARVYVTGVTVSVIDTTTNAVVATIPVSASAVAITPDGARVYVANGLTVSIIDTATNTVVDTISTSSFVRGVAITPDGTRVYLTNNVNSTITVLDTATNAVVTTISTGFNLNLVGVVFTPDGTRAYVEDQTEFLNVIDTATNTFVAHILQPIFHNFMAFTPDGTRLYVTSANIGSVFVIDPSTNAVVNSIPLGGFLSPIAPAVTPDGKRVYTVNVQNTVSAIDTATNTVIATISGFSCPIRIATAPPPQAPKSKDDCKDGGYKNFGLLAFENQGQCVKFVNQQTN